MRCDFVVCLAGRWPAPPPVKISFVSFRSTPGSEEACVCERGDSLLASADKKGPHDERGALTTVLFVESQLYSSLKPLSRKELVTTKMLLKAIAPAAMMGLSMPAAARGMPMML